MMMGTARVRSSAASSEGIVTGQHSLTSALVKDKDDVYNIKYCNCQRIMETHLPGARDSFSNPRRRRSQDENGREKTTCVLVLAFRGATASRPPSLRRSQTGGISPPSTTTCANLTFSLGKQVTPPSDP